MVWAESYLRRSLCCASPCALRWRPLVHLSGSPAGSSAYPIVGCPMGGLFLVAAAGVEDWSLPLLLPQVGFWAVKTTSAVVPAHAAVQAPAAVAVHVICLSIQVADACKRQISLSLIPINSDKCINQSPSKPG